MVALVGVICMATKSIFKNIVIRDDKTASRLATALEGKSPKGKDVTIKKKCQEITGSKIKEIFGDK